VTLRMGGARRCGWGAGGYAGDDADGDVERYVVTHKG